MNSAKSERSLTGCVTLTKGLVEKVLAEMRNIC